MKLNYIYLFKIISIFFLGTIYIILGASTSKILSKIVCNKPQKSKLKNVLFVMIESGIIMVSIYLLRQLPPLIPNPLHGFHGFNSKQISELNGGVLLSLSFLYFMGPCLYEKLDIIFDQELRSDYESIFDRSYK